MNSTHTTHLSVAHLSVPKHILFFLFYFILLLLVNLSNITSKIRIVTIFVIDGHTNISHVICRHVSSPSPYQILRDYPE